MCIAIFKQQGKQVSFDRLHNGWLNNSDGAGYCFVDNTGEIVIKKFMTWIPFYEAYLEDEQEYGNSSPFLIHFRITSKGSTTLDNCHPFRVNDDMAIIHNGTMSNIDIDKGDKRSDTKIFAEEWLPAIGEQLLDNIYLFEMAKGFIGYSKICILHRTRGVFILNEELGFWDKDDDCWYSNKSYLTAPTWKRADNYSSYQGNKKQEDAWWDYYNKQEDRVKTGDIDKPKQLILIEGGKERIVEVYPPTKDAFSEGTDYTCYCDWCSFGQAQHCCGTWVVDKYLCDECYDEYLTMYEDVVCECCKKEVVTQIYEHPIDIGSITLCDRCVNEDFKEIKLTRIGRNERGRATDI